MYKALKSKNRNKKTTHYNIRVKDAITINIYMTHYTVHYCRANKLAIPRKNIHPSFQEKN